MVLEYPPAFEFDAVISQGSFAFVTETSVVSSVKVPPQVSPNVQDGVHPVIVVKVKKSAPALVTPAPPLT